MTYSITPIGTIHSPFKEKFAVPRQPRLTPSARAKILLSDEANCEEAVRGLKQFSHLWLLFLFDQNIEKGWTPTVRPPRLGGNERIGVFASRATFRPNGIGMSAVELINVYKEGRQVVIEIGSCDLVDGTPVVDIKPYIPYSDNISEARGGFAGDQPETLSVELSSQAKCFLGQQQNGAQHGQVILEVLAQDPRPAYKKGKPDSKTYAVHLFDYNVHFYVTDRLITVIKIEDVGDSSAGC